MWWVFKMQLGTYHDDRGLGAGKERALGVRKVSYLRKSNNDGEFSEAAMPYPRLGM